MDRQRYSSGGPWEAVIGYSRAVRIGNLISVSGTTATAPDGSVEGDGYEQTKRALTVIRGALNALGADLKDVIRTRLFVRNIDDWEAIGRAHREFFGDVRPATTMVEVSRLIDSRHLVEIEADAVAA